jgi:hypothetical protein
LAQQEFLDFKELLDLQEQLELVQLVPRGRKDFRVLPD